MVQPKYSPEEALERVKLMMKYDLSKTSTENTKVVSEQTEPQKFRRKDSPLASDLKSSEIPKQYCVGIIKQFYDSWTQFPDPKISVTNINKQRPEVQRCFDQHFPRGTNKGNWGATLNGRKIDEYLLILSGCKPGTVGPTENDDDSIFKLNRRC
jgi:hypothetical protein